ncbi:MAG: protein-glutamate O-methyltransferase CheR [Oleispira antarctica]|uniref:protein-glutamate O-methyltransferase n=1 Tax=Oleispira antarctica RB-8 TaxID=698738 RepID=R4YL24_OLEAN|nr:protein-glutamate O-methyltransferase CheR [Oleispira antarctica]MBQ0794201.1 protein-glutamate O-methyltransferase CheR [Oleispira antarctica]CCK75366.1 Methylase of chemotaxis methyl-accepting protein, CheR-type [Oleispira antarctica RB-8]
MSFSISATEYSQFKQKLEQYSGIMLGENKEYLITSRLRRLLESEKLTTLSELTIAMDRNLKLKGLVIDAMTTNETLWFRDDHPFKIFSEKLLPELAKTRRPLKIWSAACSTGQEPYSLSIAIEEFKRKNPGALMGDVKIIATDISPTALAIAKEGVYPQLALKRGMGDVHLKKYFTQQSDDAWKINDDIKRRIEFRPLNLQTSYSMLGKFDIVFCRNVLIYFSADFKLDILKRIHGTLNNDGHLFVGASEAVNNLSDFYKMQQFNPGISYQAKPIAAGSR